MSFFFDFFIFSVFFNVNFFILKFRRRFGSHNFSSFMKTPPMLYLCSIKKYKTLHLRLSSYITCSYLYLDILLSLSLLSLFFLSVEVCSERNVWWLSSTSSWKLDCSCFSVSITLLHLAQWAKSFLVSSALLNWTIYIAVNIY